MGCFKWLIQRFSSFYIIRTVESSPKMTGRMFRVTLLACIITQLLFSTCTFAEQPQGRKSILILHSYHPGYKWTDDEHQGILNILNEHSTDINLYVEYLDMKRKYSANRDFQNALWMGQKYHETKIDGIITTDDVAFNFLKIYRETLFPGVPVFFCGTNYLQSNALKGLEHYYGINETADVLSTFNLIKKLFPDKTRIYIINDTTVTGKRVHDELVDAINTSPPGFEFIFLEDYSMDELLDQVVNIPENGVILYTFFFRDKNGAVFEFDDAINLISSKANVPVFAAWDFNLGHKVVGGMLVSGREQGENVAKLVLQWINETSLENIPALSSSPNKYIFDYNELTRYGVSIDKLPGDSLIINKSEDFFEKHRRVLIGSALLICFLLTVIGILLVNIKKRIRAEVVLRQSEKNFRDLFNNAREGLFQVTEDGRFIRVNSALATMLKCESPEEVLSYYTDLESHFYFNPEERRQNIELQKTHRLNQKEKKIKAKDGSEVEVMLSAHRVFDEQGQFLYYEGSVVDLTDYKRTQELIAQTDKMMALGGMSAGIAHEIKSPLSAVTMGCQVITMRLIESSKKNEEYAESCGITIRQLRGYVEKQGLAELLKGTADAALRANDIIGNMLSFSKKTTEHLEYESIAEIIDSSIKLARNDYNLTRNCGFLSVEIIKDYENQLPQILCSASMLQQVFFNLIKNGTEAMFEGRIEQPRFDIRIKKELESINIEVEDNGPGMSIEVQKNIFKPFFTTKGKEFGTGLGLSVSSFIIKNHHNGSLAVESTEGRGTKFIISLPLNGKAP